MWSSTILGKLYQYEVVKSFKNAIRPVKHAVFGASGIYHAIEDVARLSGGREKVNVVFDVGAAIGEYAVHFLNAFPNATVYCFEPLPESFAKLKKRTASYGDRVRLFPYGLLDREGDVPFYVGSHPDGSSAVDKRIGFKRKITVPVRRLDDVVREAKVPRIDFLKVDVEGTERGVLAGGRDTVAQKLMSAFVEIQPQFKGYYAPDHLAVFQQFADAGFGWGGCYHDDYFFSKLLPRS